MTRTEHMKWCKSRALELLDAGEVSEAVASMASDLGKHPDTVNHIGLQLLFATDTRSSDAVRRWIEGFN